MRVVGRAGFQRAPWPGLFTSAIGATALTLIASPAVAATSLPTVLGIPIDFILFALTLLGVAVFHNQTFYVALVGLATIAVYKVLFAPFKVGAGLAGLALHM